MARERAQENIRLYLEEAPRLRDDVYEFAKDQKISERTLERIKQDLQIRSVRAPDGDGRSTFWLLPGRLPAGVTEEMLTPVETHEQEMAAAQEDSDQMLRRIVEQYGDKPVQAKKHGEE